MILLFGMPRSGTTWYGKIFDSHPSVRYLHEPDSVHRIEAIPMFTDGADDSYDDQVKAYSETIMYSRSATVSGKRPFFRKSYRSYLSEMLFRGSIYLSKITERGGVELPVFASGAGKSNAQAAWKSIESLGRMSSFTRSGVHRGIHMVRHPCGYVASIIRGERSNQFTSRTKQADDYGIFEKLLTTALAVKHDLSIARLKEMDEVERLAWRWASYNEYAYQAQKARSNYTVSLYEAMCLDPLKEAERLFVFCGLEMQEQSRSFLVDSGSRTSADYYSVFKDSKAKYREWEKSLTTEQIDKILAILAVTSFSSMYQH